MGAQARTPQAALFRPGGLRLLVEADRWDRADDPAAVLGKAAGRYAEAARREADELTATSERTRRECETRGRRDAWSEPGAAPGRQIWPVRPRQSRGSRSPQREAAAERTLGSVVLIGCVIAVLAVLLLSAAVFDRRARARGHQLRDAGSWNAVRETRRDIKAGQTQLYLGSDRSWTAAHRRDVDADAQRWLEDGG